MFFFCYWAKIEVGSHDVLSTEKILTLNYFIILIISAVNEDQNCFAYNIYLEKCSYQLAKKLWEKFFWQHNNVEIWQDKSSK